MTENQKLLNFSTTRLLLVEITIDDLEEIHQLESIPEVDEFNTLGIPETIQDTEKLILPIIKGKSKKPRDSYTWKVVLKKTNQFIGLAGFSLSNDKYRLGEIYYKLHPNHWGKGYATELAKRLVVLGFEDLNFT